MKMNFYAFLILLLIALAANNISYAAFPVPVKHALPVDDVNNKTANTDGATLSEDEELDYLPSGHGGHAHRSHGHYHGGHSHHSHGDHHYAAHYHHYHEYHAHYHSGVWLGMDYAGLSIFFDVLGLIPIGIFSIFGVVYGAIGMRGDRRGLATAGLIIGLIELAVLAVLIAVYF